MTQPFDINQLTVEFTRYMSLGTCDPAAQWRGGTPPIFRSTGLLMFLMTLFGNTLAIGVIGDEIDSARGAIDVELYVYSLFLDASASVTFIINCYYCLVKLGLHYSNNMITS